MQDFMTEFYTILEAVRDFLELGGPVLVWISVLALVLWMFMIERLLYLGFSHRKVQQHYIDQWNARSDRTSWYAHQIRDQFISLASMNMEKNLSIIKALVVLCPLMGLLGTVTGMVEVFEVMSISGTGNARSLAAGVSKATVPTMAGMVVALSGVFLSSWLQKKAERSRELLGEKMTFQ
jgi:biopolymer transport protein ExbB